jgi:hypothetical protein
MITVEITQKHKTKVTLLGHRTSLWIHHPPCQLQTSFRDTAPKQRVNRSRPLSKPRTAQWNCCSIPNGGKEFFSGTHPASYSTGSRKFSQDSKTATTWHWKSASIQWRGYKCSRYTSTQTYIFVTWCLIKRKNNFTFNLRMLSTGT